ncbi:MAG: FliM/FliN family flagellar motor switch protein [Planctomycetota bacterium]
MLKPKLSRDEIDALFEESVPSEGGEGEGKTEESFSFAKPNRLTWSQMEMLHATFHAVAQRVATAVSRPLVMIVGAQLWRLEQMRYDAFVASIPLPAALVTVDYEPMSRPWLIAFSPKLAGAAVDRILGGSGVAPEDPKDLTPLEWSVAEPFVQGAIEGVSAGFKELIELKGHQLATFSDSKLVRVASDHEVVLSAEIRFGGELPEESVWICLIPDELDPLLEKNLEAADAERGTIFRPVIESHLRSLQTDLRVLLDNLRVPMKDFLDWKVGDVLPLNRGLDEPLSAEVEGRKKFEGRLGTIHGELAFRVDRSMPNIADEEDGG